MTRDHHDPRAWLGLTPDAGDVEVEQTRERLEEYLADAPPELAGWARAQRSGAYGRPVTTATTPLNPQGGAVRRRRSPLVPLSIVAVATAVGVIVYNIPDGGTAAADPKAAASTPAHAQGTMPAATPEPLDQAKVDGLNKKIAANPKDTKALKELANEYSRTEMYKEAAATQAKILEVEPKNTDARLAYGVAHFNMNDLPTAEKAWNEVVAQDPKNVEAYYDLGFLHLSKSPPQMDKAQAAWEKVVELDPTSELAGTVKSHLDKFKSGAAADLGGSTSPTAVPSGAATSAPAQG